MGDHKFPDLGKKESELRTCADVMVIASQAHIATLSYALDSEALPGLRLIEAKPDEAVAETALEGASVAVIEVDPHDPNSMRRLSHLHRVRLGVPIIAAIPDASVSLVRSLVREGVADVIALPFDADELLDSALNVLANRSASEGQNLKLAPMVAIACSTGGCGATSISTHLAAALAERTGRKAAIVDLDVQFGSVSEFLSTKGRGTIADLLEAGERLDEELIRSVTRYADGGLAVIAAPNEIIPLEAVDTDQLLRVLEHLRHHFDQVVLDLPADWTNWTLSAAHSATTIVLVVELSVASLRQAARRLELLQSVGIPKSRIVVVVNRVERRLFRSVGLDDVAETLHHPALASIALDEPAVSSAQDQGHLVTNLFRKSRFGSDIAQLAELLLDGPLGEKS